MALRFSSQQPPVCQMPLAPPVNPSLIICDIRAVKLSHVAEKSKLYVKFLFNVVEEFPKL